MYYYESHRSGGIVSRLRDIREVNFLVSQVASFEDIVTACEIAGADWRSPEVPELISWASS